jgi:hypothetical protein
MNQQTSVSYIAGLGAILWTIALVVLNLHLIEQLVLFALFVVTPVTFHLARLPYVDEKTRALHTFILRIIPWFAVLTSAAFLYPAGWIAGALSLPWLIISLLIAYYGLRGLMERGFVDLAECSIHTACLYLPVGAFHFTLYQLGWPLFSFDSVIILLTAIHFHFSTFPVLVMIGLWGRLTELARTTSKIYRFIALISMISPIGIAIGMTYFRTVEFLFVCLFVLALWLYAFITMTGFPKTAPKAQYRLIRLSSFFLLFTRHAARVC